MANFSETFNEFLLDNNLNPKKLKSLVYISDSLLYDYKKGIRIPNINNLIKLCKYFNCSIDYMLGRSDVKRNFNNITPKSFAEIYNKLLKESGENTTQIANKLGINTIEIYNWINKKHTPTTESLIKLANYFGCSVDYLVGIEK